MKMLRRELILTYVFFFVMASVGYSETKKIQVSHTDWFPYTYQENGKSLGFEIEIFMEVMKNMGIEAELEQYPWKRCLHNLETGKSDVLISLLKTPEREAYTYFPDTHISISKTVFFTKADKDIKFNGSYEELKGFNIGVIMGFSYGEAFDKADYLKKDAAKDTQTLITMLLNGRHELSAENQAVVSAYAMKMGVKDKIRFLEPPIHTQKLYVGFSKAKGLKKLCDDFSKSLAEFSKSESYKAILEKYGLNPAEMAKID